MSRAATAGRPSDASGGQSTLRYIGRSELPLTSLVFLLPFIVIYEVGTRYFTTAAQQGRDEQIIAFSKLQQFCGLLGAEGRHLPALCVVGVLLTWHIARKDSWDIDLRVLIGMAMESLTLAVPVILIGYALPRYFPLMATSARTDRIILAFGAGVYEEFAFRLLLFGVLSFFLHDLMKLGRWPAHLFIVAASAFLFSAYHYLSPHEHFVLQTFIFRTIAGAYFGVVFLARGFGITAASHSFYDLLIMSL